MTPEERALRDAYLAELWPTCREVPRAVREDWAAELEPKAQVPEPVSRFKGRRALCPACGREYAASKLARHIRGQHAPSDLLVQRWQQRSAEAS